MPDLLVIRAMSPATRQAARLALGTASALGLARFAYGLLLPAMSDDLRWTLAEAGAMSTANGLGYLLGALVTAPVVRRWGGAAVFRWGMVLTAVALAAAAVADDYVALLTTRAAAGAAGALVFITGGVIASRIAARAASGVPITVYFAGAGVGIVFSGATIPVLGDHWRLGWAGLSVAAGVATLVSWAAAGGDRQAPAATRGRARVRPLWGTALAYLLFAAGYITYITFLSAYLADRRATTGQTVATWAALGLAVVAGPALWSRPTSQWPGTRALATLLGVLAGGAALALAAPTPPVILASAIVYGATFMCVPAAVTALIRANTPPADWAVTLAAFTTLFAVGQTAGPWVAGIVADHTSTDAPLAWTAILCAAAAVTAATTGRSRSSPTGGLGPASSTARLEVAPAISRPDHRAAGGTSAASGRNRLPSDKEHDMATFVLIPGMCHGGWSYGEVTEWLRGRGHRVYPLTLTGISERSHLLHAGVNLETHIQDVTGVLAAEDIQDAVLVGHSYGGMVVTAVADRMPGRVGSLVYLDAVVPANGDSCFGLVTDKERQWYLDVVENGYATRPLPFFDARATPHPLASLLQPLPLTSDLAHVRRKVYVYAAGWDGESPFTPFYNRLREDPSWTTHALDSRHNIMRDAPKDLLRILLDVVEPR